MWRGKVRGTQVPKVTLNPEMFLCGLGPQTSLKRTWLAEVNRTLLVPRWGLEIGGGGDSVESKLRPLAVPRLWSSSVLRLLSASTACGFSASPGLFQGMWVACPLG